MWPGTLVSIPEADPKASCVPVYLAFMKPGFLRIWQLAFVTFTGAIGPGIGDSRGVLEGSCSAP